MKLPRRVFLDTNVVNFILDHGGSIFENEDPEGVFLPQDLNDIEALRLVFQTGERAHWELAVSPLTYAEISNTTNARRRHSLKIWFNEVWVHWRTCFEEDGLLSDEFTASVSSDMESSGMLKILPDQADRELLAHAIAYECDAFCTRDKRTILKYKDRLPLLNMDLISPSEWGERIQPYAALF